MSNNYLFMLKNMIYQVAKMLKKH